MTTTETKVVQKKGFYEITTPAGGKAKLTRVTTALDWVLKEGTGGMAYYGGKLFAKFLAETDEEVQEFYEQWKASEWDPNAQLRSTSDRGQTAHTLLGDLINGKVVVRFVDDQYLIHDKTGNDPDFIAVKWDRGAVEVYLALYSNHEATYAGEVPRSEVRLYWTEHPIDNCPSLDRQGRCTHGFSGTCDVYFPNWALDDLKTHIPGYRWSEWGQMAMYSLAASQLYGASITRQRIILAHDTPVEDEESPYFGKYYEVQDDRFLPAEAGRLIWELFKHRKEWGPKS